MTAWECSIDGCGETYDRVEDAIVHQTNDHQRAECKICGSVIPDGYFAIKHAFEEHSRAEYVRTYGASATDIRDREQIKEEIEVVVDLQEVVNQLNDTTGGSLLG